MYSRHISGTQYCTVLIYIVDYELFVKYIVDIDDDPKLIPIGGSAADESGVLVHVGWWLHLFAWYIFCCENFMDVLRSNFKCVVCSLKLSLVAVTIL